MPAAMIFPSGWIESAFATSPKPKSVRHAAVAVERSVERPVGVVASEREVGARVKQGSRLAGHHDLAVRLDDHGVARAGAAEVGTNDAAAPEGAVERAGRGIPRDPEG